MKPLWDRQLIFFCLTITWGLTVATAVDPEMRKWTSTSGSEIEAVLLQYDESSASLRFSSGGEKKIPLAQLSGADLDYLKRFPDLKSETPPWVTFKAKTGASGRKRGYYSMIQRKALDIELSNREKHEVTVDVIWVMLGRDLETGGDVVIDFGKWQGRLKSGESKAFRTPASTTSFSDGRRYYSYYGGYYYHCNYYYKGGSEITSFLAQARWKDKLLAGVTGAPSQRIKDLAGRADLIAGLTEAGFKVEPDLAKQIRSSMKAVPPPP